MTNYNLIIIECKIQTCYLNLTKREFFEHLWEWTFEYDLWDNIEANNLLSNREDLEDWILNFVIPECMLHNYEDDEIDCIAFTNSDEKCKVHMYKGDDEDLIDFIIEKINKHYENL